MHFIRIEDLLPGMVTGEIIYLPGTPRVLISDNVELNQKLIDRLKELNIPGVKVRDKEYNILFSDSCLNNELQDHIMEQLKTVEVRNGVIISNRVLEMAEDIVDQFLLKKNVSFEMISRMTGKNEYRHALNVCEFSIAIGKSMEMNRIELVELASAALMHDFGKMCANQEVLNQLSLEKIAKYQETFKSISDLTYRYDYHPIFGACLIDKNVDPSIKYAILYHQKNDNNTGIPFGIKIDKEKSKGYDRIIHVCDFYDNLLTGTKMIGRDEVRITSPVEAYQTLFKEVSDKRMSIDTYNLFVEAIPIYPKGITVELSDGTIGVVYFNLGENALYPKILTTDNKVMDLLKPEFLNNPIVNSYWNDELTIKRGKL